MKGTLIRKEILNRILDFRFVVSSILALILVIFSAVILSENYKKELDLYETALADDERDLADVRTFSQFKPKIHYPPDPLSIFNRGIMDRANRTLTIQYGWIPRQTTETESENPFLKILRPFDLTAVLRIVLSLLAILLVYDSICGEREEGTLGLMLSHTAKRSRILLSKLTSGIILLCIPVFLSFIVSLLVITVIFGIGFSPSEWLRIGMIILSTLLFLTFILSAGILVSSLVKNSAVSLLISTCLWVILCIIQPNLDSFIASSVVVVPSNERIEKSYSALWDEFADIYAARTEVIVNKLPEGRQNGNIAGWNTIDGTYVVNDGTTPLLLRFLYMTQELEPVRQDNAQREWDIYRTEYLPFLEKQFRIQQILDRLAPAAIFNALSASLSRTDVRHYEHFLQGARNYRNTLMSYLNNDRKIFSENANEYFTQLGMDEIHNSHYDQREANNATYTFENTSPMDITGIPEYRFQRMGFAAGLNHLILDFFLLLSYSLVVFLVSMYRFVKYDPRQN